MRCIAHVLKLNLNMNIVFTGKVVLITGASAGIGEATALLFAKLGANLALVGRNQVNLKNVAERCEKEKSLKPLQIIADLSTDEGVEKTAEQTTEHFGRLDVLVNNAGVSARTCLETTDMATFDKVFNVNVRGVYNLTRLLLPALVRSSGNVVNVSSIAATTTLVGNLPYAMAKAALDQFSRGIALELAPKGVRVNTVSPGITRSTIIQRMTGYSDVEYQEWLDKVASAAPLRKICEGIDIAKMIAHLSSDHSRLVTGTTVQVDGGLQFAGIGNKFKDQIKKNLI